MDGLENVVLNVRRQFRVHGQAQHILAKLLCSRESTLRVAVTGKGRLFVQRPGIIDHGGNARRFEVRLECIALAVLHVQSLLVKDMGGGGIACGNHQPFELA